MHAHSHFLDTSKCKDKSLTKLHIAVIREDVEKVKKYVKRGQEDVNQQVPQKRFKSLLSKEENLVNVRDRYARTPLHLCATNGNQSPVRSFFSGARSDHYLLSQN